MTRRRLFPLLAAAPVAAVAPATPILKQTFNVDVIWYPRSQEKAYQFYIKGKLHEFDCTHETELFFADCHKVEVQDLVAEYIADAEGCLTKPDVNFNLWWPSGFKMKTERRKPVSDDCQVKVHVGKEMSGGSFAQGLTYRYNHVRYKLTMSSKTHTLVMTREAVETWTDSQPVCTGDRFRRA